MRSIGVGMRGTAIIDRVLTETARTLMRFSDIRPYWLQPGMAMRFVLTRRRRELLEVLVDDSSLRAHIRYENRRLLDPSLLDGVCPEEFESFVTNSSDPYRLVATALVDADDLVVEACGPWVLDPNRIPKSTPTTPSAVVRSDDQTTSSGTEADGSVADAGDDARPPESGDHVDNAGQAVAAELQEPSTAGSSHDEYSYHELRSERDNLRSEVKRLEKQVGGLQAKVPTKGQRRRRNKQEGELKRARARLDVAAAQLDSLRAERDDLLSIKEQLDDQITEAEEAQALAVRKSQQLERRIATPEGRAEYLRRSVENELTEAQALHQNLSYGPDRTDVGRRIETLTTLLNALEDAFPVEAEPPPSSHRLEVGASHEFIVTPLGGDIEIGGSAILIEAAGRRVLVDAGMHPDGHGPSRISQLGDKGLDAVVVTHAHNDHAGYIPALIERFPRARVFCSDATAHLLPTMWADSARLMERTFVEADDGTDARLPLYGSAEVETAESRIEERSFQRPFTLGDLRLTLFPAGHILGAAGVVIEGGNCRIVVTGDISGPDDQYRSVEPAHLPEGLIRGADLLIIETTYCHSDHHQRSNQEYGLVKSVRSVVERRGRVLIPAFGLGRAQEVILILRSQLPEINMLVDGIARDISTIYERMSEASGQSLSILGGKVQQVRNRARELRSFNSGVIVASSGMLTGGPSVAWAQKILPDERDALLLCGYQDEESPGRRLERLLNGNGPRTLKLPDQEEGWIDVEVKADVRKYSLSAHADRRGLLEIIDRVRPKETMLVHGFPEPQAEFRDALNRRGHRTVLTDRWTSRRT
jgi:Cft2 family RNA processing exonuclease